MTTIYEIPLTAAPQTLSVAIAGVSYQLRLLYHNTAEGGWALDISDAAGSALVCGVPLVTGADLLAQYAYLDIGAQLRVVTDGAANATPTFANLGSTAHLYCGGA